MVLKVMQKNRGGRLIRDEGRMQMRMMKSSPQGDQQKMSRLGS